MTRLMIIESTLMMLKMIIFLVIITTLCFRYVNNAININQGYANQTDYVVSNDTNFIINNIILVLIEASYKDDCNDYHKIDNQFNCTTDEDDNNDTLDAQFGYTVNNRTCYPLDGHQIDGNDCITVDDNHITYVVHYV